MSESRRNQRRRRASRTATESQARTETEAIVPAAAASIERSEAEWRRWSDGFVDQINRKVRGAGLAKEEAADIAFSATFGSDTESALDPKGHPTMEYLRVVKHDGKSLILGKNERLDDYIRIGALNQHRRDAAWRNLDWTFKLELLPLLGPEITEENGEVKRTITMERFTDGLAFANGQNVGTSHIRDYVRRHTPPSVVGRPRGHSLTLPRAGRFTQTGVMLADAEQRAKFVERLRAAPAKVQRELLKDMRDTHSNLGALLREIEKANG